MKRSFSPSGMADQILAVHAGEGAALRLRFFEEHSREVKEAALAIARALAKGSKILICGNGGSAADSQHLAAEFVNQFMLERPALAAISLATDTSALTAIGNDRGFDEIFRRQVEALGSPGDVLLGISTSGKSPNVLKAMAQARKNRMVVIALCGSGGSMASFADHLLAVPSTETPLIQEVHLAVEHLLCRLVDYYLFENPEELAVGTSAVNED